MKDNAYDTVKSVSRAQPQAGRATFSFLTRPVLALLSPSLPYVASQKQTRTKKANFFSLSRGLLSHL